MKLSELVSIAGSEEKFDKFCPFCRGKSIGRVRGKFFRCYVIIAGG